MCSQRVVQSRTTDHGNTKNGKNSVLHYTNDRCAISTLTIIRTRIRLLWSFTGVNANFIIHTSTWLNVHGHNGHFRNNMSTRTFSLWRHSVKFYMRALLMLLARVFVSHGVCVCVCVSFFVCIIWLLGILILHSFEKFLTVHPTWEIKKYKIQSVMKNSYNCLYTSVRDRAGHFVRHWLDDIYTERQKKRYKI